MKRRNFLFSAFAICLIPIRKIFGKPAIDLTATQTIETKAIWGTARVSNQIRIFPPHTTKVCGPIKFDMPGFRKTLAPGESVTIIQDKKTGQWKEADHCEDGAAVATP